MSCWHVPCTAGHWAQQHAGARANGRAVHTCVSTRHAWSHLAVCRNVDTVDVAQPLSLSCGVSWLCRTAPEAAAHSVTSLHVMMCSLCDHSATLIDHVCICICMASHMSMQAQTSVAVHASSCHDGTVCSGSPSGGIAHAKLVSLLSSQSTMHSQGCQLGEVC